MKEKEPAKKAVKKVAKKAAKKSVVKGQGSLVKEAIKQDAENEIKRNEEEIAKIKGFCGDVSEKKPDCCATCRFSKEYDAKMVVCRRYPSPPGVRDQSTMLKDGWCGEFQKGE